MFKRYKLTFIRNRMLGDFEKDLKAVLKKHNVAAVMYYIRLDNLSEDWVITKDLHVAHGKDEKGVVIDNEFFTKDYLAKQEGEK